MRKIQKFQSILAVCISLCLGIGGGVEGTAEEGPGRTEGSQVSDRN